MKITNGAKEMAQAISCDLLDARSKIIWTWGTKNIFTLNGFAYDVSGEKMLRYCYYDGWRYLYVGKRLLSVIRNNVDAIYPWPESLEK